MAERSTSRAAEIPADDDIDLIAVGRSLWRSRLLIAAVAAGAVLIAILYLQFATYTYTATMQVTAAESSTGTGLAGSLGGLGALASLAGFNLPTQEATSPFQLYLESLHSRAVADDLAKHTDLMSVLFSAEWDAKARTWRPPAVSLRPLRTAVKAVLGMPNYPWQPPDGARLQEYLEVAVKVDQNPKSPVVGIRMEHKDPQFAVKFLGALHAATDQMLREKALARTTEYVRYLSNKLETVTVAEHRMALAQALSEQEKVRMMTSATTPFAADPFGRPVASRRYTSPRTFAVLLLSVPAGLIAGIATALIVGNWRSRASQPARDS
jgi:uncharacterized protein involved in exopolysaccharide biosynthesis